MRFFKQWTANARGLEQIGAGQFKQVGSQADIVKVKLGAFDQSLAHVDEVRGSKKTT